MSRLDNTHDYTPGFLSTGGFDSAAMSFFHDGNDSSLNTVVTTTANPSTLELLCLKNDSEGFDNRSLDQLPQPIQSGVYLPESIYYNNTFKTDSSDQNTIFSTNELLDERLLSHHMTQDMRQEPTMYSSCTSHGLLPVNSNHSQYYVQQHRHVEVPPTDRTVFLNSASNITPQSHIWHGIIPTSVGLIGGSVVNTPLVFQLPVSTSFPILNFPSIQHIKKKTEDGITSPIESALWNSLTSKERQNSNNLSPLNGHGDESSDTKKKPTKRKRTKATDEYHIEEDMNTTMKNDILDDGNIDILPKRKYKKRKKEESEEGKTDSGGASHGELIKMKKSRMAYNKGTFIIRYSDMESPEYAGHIWLVDNHQLLQKYTLDGVKGDGIREYSKTERYSGWLCDEPCLYFPLAEVKESYDNMQKVIVSFFPSPQEIEAAKKEQLKQKLDSMCVEKEHIVETHGNKFPMESHIE